MVFLECSQVLLEASSWLGDGLGHNQFLSFRNCSLFCGLKGSFILFFLCFYSSFLLFLCFKQIVRVLTWIVLNNANLFEITGFWLWNFLNDWALVLSFCCWLDWLSFCCWLDWLTLCAALFDCLHILTHAEVEIFLDDWLVAASNFVEILIVSHCFFPFLGNASCIRSSVESLCVFSIKVF